MDTMVKQVRNEAKRKAREIEKEPKLPSNAWLDYGYQELNIEEIRKLIYTIKKLDRQNQRLAKTNLALQWVAMILGIIAVFFGTSQILNTIFKVPGWQNILLSSGITLLVAVSFRKRIKK